MKLKLKKSEWLDDWYVIERAEHDGREWLEPISGVVEGTAAEMRDIARAIEQRGRTSHKRCAVKVDGDKAELWSPRNSMQHGEVSLAEADDLARQIRELLSDPPGEVHHA